MTWPENLNSYLSAALFVIGAYVVAVYLGLIVWTFRDIRARSRDMLAQIMATFLVAVFGLPGLLVYVLMRPKTTLAEEYERSMMEEAVLVDLDKRHTCPECQRQVESDFIVCPHCHHQLRLRCTGCGRLLSPSWDVCPYCGRFRAPAASAATIAPTATATATPPVEPSAPQGAEPTPVASELAESAANSAPSSR